MRCGLDQVRHVHPPFWLFACVTFTVQARTLQPHGLTSPPPDAPYSSTWPPYTPHTPPMPCRSPAPTPQTPLSSGRHYCYTHTLQASHAVTLQPSNPSAAITIQPQPCDQAVLCMSPGMNTMASRPLSLVPQIHHAHLTETFSTRETLPTDELQTS